MSAARRYPRWENGTSDPNTSNLIALAKLYGISAEELLKNVEHYCRNRQTERKQRENRVKEKQGMHPFSAFCCPGDIRNAGNWLY